MLRRVGYYMRFFVEDGQPLSLSELATGLRAADPAFRLAEDGELSHGEQLLAELEVNTRGEELFDEELEEFLELAGESETPAGRALARRLKGTSAILAVQVLWGGRSSDATLGLLAPLWDWLREHRRGLVQADGEGFYEGDALIFGEE
jgi:hypothetical protein